ncbi:hypothetical protein RIF29_13891 [Crotalaria pallida]|uniref:Uncharacterized protein n=1 Tax=Crotalaria pallida TaxID=3830 RepID=A0AAN9FEI1_CROPI
MGLPKEHVIQPLHDGDSDDIHDNLSKFATTNGHWMLFLWKVAWQCLLTNDARRRRHLTLDGTCPACQEGDEDLFRLLCDCPYAIMVCWHFIPTSDLSRFMQGDFKQWFHNNLVTSIGTLISKHDWPILFALALEHFWYCRNKLVFENEYVSLLGSVKMFRMRSKEICRALRTSDPVTLSSIQNRVFSISWKRPEEGWVKLNTDGSFFQAPESAACGGIMRDHIGSFVSAFSCQLGNCSIIDAELWAILHGLRLAYGRGLRRVVMESDSLVAIRFLQEGCVPTHECAPLVR